VHFRKRIGTQGFKLIFKMSIELHGSLAQEPSVLINTTVQEKNITYPRRVVWIDIEVLVIRVALKLQHNTLVREGLQLKSTRF
jgi:hypothetical protein